MKELKTYGDVWEAEKRGDVIEYYVFNEWKLSPNGRNRSSYEATDKTAYPYRIKQTYIRPMYKIY